ncbi:hypothetical protein [Nonomuraea aurantiaca]|uniref:hypothetical protein n=1 Tax=Nonomuraea aurantiaca TaxID=2878562 RepID=UPI001CD962DE|nr:hypothetical protein [Nonomuraea aurantiaca]MCA2229647.1 hypothetical protein [Nonomuraea aurantiaca]
MKNVHEVAAALPPVEVLRDHCRALAMVDAIRIPEWEYREYSFDSRWAPGEEMASWRSGAGDDYSIVFCLAGVYIRGFDHESPVSPFASDDLRPWPGVVDDVPEVFRPQLDEVAFTLEDVPLITCCLWRTTSDDRWRTGRATYERDGSDQMFDLLIDRSPAAYVAWAATDEDEPPVPVEPVAHIFALRPLTEEVVRALNPEIGLRNVRADLQEIGYPLG